MWSIDYTCYHGIVFTVKDELCKLVALNIVYLVLEKEARDQRE